MSLGKAYMTSAEIFRQVSKRYDSGLLEDLDKRTADDIIVVPGTYDSVENLLKTLHIPYRKGEFPEHPQQHPAKIAFLNCDCNADPGDVRNFVKRGGRVISTDWSLEILEEAFPGKLKNTDNDTEDDVVEIQCYTPLSRQFIGMHYAQCHPKWWLEGSSHVYKIKDNVTPIITSKEMEDKYGSPYIAVGFNEGKGEVLHFISHFVLQRTHQRSKADKGTLDDFLKNMKATKSTTMKSVNVAELESAYSTLNTVAQLCTSRPLLELSTKSVLRRGA